MSNKIYTLSPYYAAQYLLHQGKKKGRDFWRSHFRKYENVLTPEVTAKDGYLVRGKFIERRV